MIYCIKIMARQTPLSSKGMSKGSRDVDIDPRRLASACLSGPSRVCVCMYVCLSRAPRPLSVSRGRESARPRARAAGAVGAPAARAPHRAQKQRGRNLARPLSSMCVYRISIYCAFIFTRAHPTPAARCATLSTLATPGVCLFSAKQSATAEATALRTCAHTTSQPTRCFFGWGCS